MPKIVQKLAEIVFFSKKKAFVVFSYFEIWKSYEKRGIIKQGIDGDRRDKWDRKWWNGCDNKRCLWYWWLGAAILWVERENREIKNCYWK